MIVILQQITVKIISAVAGLIIAMGIVEMPIPLSYQPPAHNISDKKVEKEETGIIKEILPEPKLEQPKKILPPPPAATPAASLKQPKQQTQQPPSPEPSGISLTELNQKARGAIVNIFCTTKTAGAFKPITASGVITSPKGIVLINAHMGQYFLMEKEQLAGYLNCIIRKGDIAKNAYDAKLVYISSAWIEKNSDNIIQEAPKGTGEDDFALLLINESLTQGTGLPSTFAFGEPNLNFGNFPADLSALLASYPAGFLGGVSVQKELGLVSTFAPIKISYTFSQTEPATLDIFSLGGNIASQGGSSGGGVFDTRNGKLLGIIVTSGEGTTTASRELNVISLPYIGRSFEKYTGYKFENFLNSPESFPNILSETEFTRLKNILLKKLRSASN